MRRSAIVLLSLLTLSRLALGDEPAPARIFYNAHIFTGEPTQPYADAVAIRGDKIVAVGALAEVKAAAGPTAQAIDLKGKFLMPGMIDAHAHPIDGGLSLIMANFPDSVISVPHLHAYVDKMLASGKSRFGDVMIIYGLDVGFWTHTSELNAVFSKGAYAKQKLILYGSDGHTAWGNAALLAAAGITPDFIKALPEGDRRYYGVDKAGAPTGFVVDVGQSYLSNHLPKASAALLLEAGHAALHYMNGLGLTGWLDAAVSGVVGGDLPATLDDPGYLPTYVALAEQGELTAHIAAYPVVHPDGGSQQIAVVKQLRAHYQRLPDLAIPGLKVFADGVVEIPSQTAALTKPYRNSGKQSPVLFTPSKFADLVTEADRDGLTVHVHAIGDLAVKEALDGFAAARQANGPFKLPHTITHVQFADPEDVPRFGQLGVFAALQLLWADAEPGTIEEVKPYIDDSIYRTMYPARAMLDSGAVIAGASDWPVSTPNPFAAIYIAETRRGPEGVLDPAQRMPRAAMLFAYTHNAAQVLNQLDRIGTLAPGKQADLVLLDRDVLTVQAEEMRDAKVLWTMLGGKIVAGQGP
jgi:predicted amidohydrolase YtcJ